MINDDPRILDVANWDENIVFFMGGEGEQQIAAGFHSSGTDAGWKAAITPIAKYPRVRLVFYASLVAPLLEVVGAPNFVLDVAHPTSRGKTTTLRVAAAVWGKPDESGIGSMWTWEKTPVWIERALSVLNSIPMILDDTKLARYPDLVGRILYLVASGSGRGRGTQTGLDYIRHFRTILITSGEAPATSFTPDGGTRARTLELWGSPFERADASTAPDVDRLNTELQLHYGHAGPKFVQHLLDNQDKWGDYRELYLEKRAKYVRLAEGDPVVGRLAAYFGVIDTAAALAHEALDLPWSYSDPVDPLWETLTAEASEADRAQVALGYMSGWAARNQHAFVGRAREDQHGEPIPPHGGWAGRWDAGDGWEFIAFYPDFLRRTMREMDFDYEAVLRTWKDRGWLDAPKKRRNTKLMRVNGVRAELITVKKEALEKEDVPETA